MMIDSRIVGDIYFLDCRGKITAGENAMAVRTTVGGILKDGGKKIVLNLADIVYMDNSGLGALVSAYNNIAKHGGQLRLLRPTQRIRELLSIMKLLTVFQIYDNEPATIAAFV